MLYKLNLSQYSSLISIANAHGSGCIYPLSVAEGVQDGEIFADSVDDFKSILFWTYPGFAYISGEADERFLNEIYDLMVDKNKTNVRRFLLMTKDKYVQDFFSAKDEIVLERRYLFKYEESKDINEYRLPAGYELKEIDSELLKKISGRIVPSLFWKDGDDFLTKGKGYCITFGDEIVSWAFSSAVSSKEIDIGIETAPQYKQRGFGTIIAAKMVQYAKEQSKSPVWACHHSNLGSRKTAERLGFVKESECMVIKKT